MTDLEVIDKLEAIAADLAAGPVTSSELIRDAEGRITGLRGRRPRFNPQGLCTEGSALAAHLERLDLHGAERLRCARAQVAFYVAAEPYVSESMRQRIARDLAAVESSWASVGETVR